MKLPRFTAPNLEKLTARSGIFPISKLLWAFSDPVGDRLDLVAKSLERRKRVGISEISNLDKYGMRKLLEENI